MRSAWNAVESPVEIISSLSRYKEPYLDTLFGKNKCGFSNSLSSRFSQLAALGAPSSILPFTMQLGRAVLDGDVQENAAADVLGVIESFLVRRAVVGFEPTGLHAVFKRLWADLNGNFSALAVSQAISSHKTVTWPGADDVLKAIESRPLYGSAITPYFLREYDSSFRGDVHDNIETIEHVLPQSADHEWKKIYGEEFCENDKDALPNLVPCTGKMNSSLGNQSYAAKRERFAKDSKFKSTREFSAQFQAWNRGEFLTRSKKMGDWAIKRWPHERISPVTQGN